MIFYIINLALCLFGTFVLFYFLILRFIHWSFKLKWKDHVSNGYWFRNVFRWGIVSLDLKGRKVTIGNVKFVKPETDQISEIGNLKISHKISKAFGTNNLFVVGKNIYIDLIYFKQSGSMKGTMIYNDRTHYVSFPVIDNIEKLVIIKNTPSESVQVDQKELLEKHAELVKEVKNQDNKKEETKSMGGGKEEEIDTEIEIK